LEDLYEDYVDLLEYFSEKTLKKTRNMHNFFISYSRLYNYLFQKITYDAFFFFIFLKKKKNRPLYHLILTFRNNKMFVNINDRLKRNYFFISTGLFIKYFEKKKLFKKSKVIRTLLIKYLRKIFLLINFPRTILIVKKNPIFFLDFLNLFNQQIPHKFHEPLTNREIIDNKPNKNITKFLYFIFLNAENFTKNKTKKQGRVKRKIFRKIVSRNSIID
jgi:hypothetical protein